MFKWQSFVPGIRAARPQPAPQPEPEPEVELSEEGESVRERVGRLVEDNAEALEALGGAELDVGRAPEPGELVEEGQLFEKNGEMQVAESLNEQNELLADGWKPVQVD